MKRATALLLSFLVGGCTRSPAPTPAPAKARSSAPAAAARVPTPDEAPRAHLSSTLFDRELLQQLEERGLDFGSLLADLPHANNEILAQAPAWGGISRALEGDVTRIAAMDEHAGVSVARFSHRLFDVRFLTSKNARFRLVGVAARLDRRPFVPNSCGETRLVYRLEYDNASLRSALPATAIFEFRVPAGEDGSCRSAAARFRLPASAADFLRSEDGPLSQALLGRDNLLQVATNVQTVRWPSSVRPDLGGHAEYTLRAFAWSSARREFAPRLLENTPDVERLKSDAPLRRELLAWLREPATMAAVERGHVLLPARFLARVTTSVSPRGLSRLHNRPFRQLFEPRDFDRESLSGPLVQSAEAYLRRLDQMSCSGCHQARSIAGFHFLGADDPEAPPGTALATPLSPHAFEEMGRRDALMQAWLTGEPADETPPFAEHGRAAGGYGAACGLGDASFAAWTCDPDLSCQPYDAPSREGDQVGTCLPSVPGVGDPCEYGPLEARADPHRDRATRVTRRDCAATQACNRNAVGFPGGMCTASCDDAGANGRCGAIAILEPFNACLARKQPFSACLAEHTRPSGLRACSLQNPCRDDYACVRGASGGVCVPPYFLFQLRVDGHEAGN